MTAPGEWSSWAGTVRCRPRAIARPENEDEVVEVVRSAARAGAVVRPVGSGHSSAPLVETDGVLLSLDAFAGLESCDPDAALATVRAGTTLHDLGPLLFAHGLALENLGDVDVQALGGALATGTHGTGVRLGNLASRVEALRLVTASGEVLDCAPGTDLLRAARVSLGALGS